MQCCSFPVAITMMILYYFSVLRCESNEQCCGFLNAFCGSVTFEIFGKCFFLLWKTCVRWARARKGFDNLKKAGGGRFFAAVLKQKLISWRIGERGTGLIFFLIYYNRRYLHLNDALQFVEVVYFFCVQNYAAAANNGCNWQTVHIYW